MTTKLRAVYAVPLVHSPAEMAKANRADITVSGALIKSANTKLE